MKITIITSNLPRHNYLVNCLSKLNCDLFVIQECQTHFPGRADNGHYKVNAEIKKYFKEVNKSQNKFFKKNTKLHLDKVKIKSLSFNDLNMFKIADLSTFLKSDLYIVFGSSYLKGDLVNFLIKKKAINIHMGISPYYRGTDCNFWAVADRNFHLVGATVHLLSKGVDSGEILFHSLPKHYENPFDFTMSSVKSVINNICKLIKTKKIFKLNSKKQNKIDEIRYTTKKNFDEKKIKLYKKIKKIKKITYDKSLYVNPQF